MRAFLMTTSAAALAASSSFAGGVDRGGQSTDILFETGRVLEFGFNWVEPKVSGQERDIPIPYPTESDPPPINGSKSGGVLPAYTFASAAYKADVGDNLSYALIINQPFGADVDYPTGTGYYAAGANATLRSTAVTGLLKFSNSQNFSVFGGARAQSLEANISVPFVGEYSATGDLQWKGGWVVGIGWEKPDIAARVTLTFNSEIDYNLDTSETIFVYNPPDYVGFATTPSKTSIKLPKTVDLHFQTGIAADTLLFGSIRWANWTVFDVQPQVFYKATGGSIVAFDNNRTTFNLGLGRKLSDAWSVAGTLGYEKTIGGISSNLSPTDGYKSVGLGATYAQGNMKISGGVQYIWVGEAQTQFGGPPFSPAADWKSNTGLAAGMKVTFKL